MLSGTQMMNVKSSFYIKYCDGTTSSRAHRQLSLRAVNDASVIHIRQPKHGTDFVFDCGAAVSLRIVCACVAIISFPYICLNRNQGDLFATA